MNGPLTINGADWPGMLIEKASNGHDITGVYFSSATLMPFIFSRHRVFSYKKLSTNSMNLMTK